MKRTEFKIDHILNNKSISGEHWMTNLSPLLRQLPLIYLCIPGTIESQSFSTALPENKKYQQSNITSQLFNGIRYLNISTYKYKNDWMCCNKIKFADILRQISLFGVCHPNEIIFIELNIVAKVVHHDIECLNIIIQRLLPLLVTKTNDKFWISKFSLNSICNTGKNIMLINNKYAKYNERIFSTCTKYIHTCSINKLNNLLNKAPLSICSTYKIPSFSIKLMWSTKSKYNFLKCKIDKLVTMSHENIIEYVTSSNKNVDNLNKICIFCVEYECYIDLLYLCMQIMEIRFFQ